MAIQFDASKVAMFRNVQLADDDSMANLGDKRGLKSAGLYTGIWSSRSRTAAQKTANNAVRTELLKSLGQAFRLSGMKEDGGKVRFSKDFMNRLEKILGNDILKRGDFKISSDGTVASGRPLTKRRIQAIIGKAIMVGKTGFDTDIYRTKLDAIKKELGIAGLSGNALKAAMNKNSALRMFVIADQGLEFLRNCLFLARTATDAKTGQKKTVYGPRGEEVDHSFIRVNPEYIDILNDGGDPEAEKCHMYEVRKGGDKGCYKPYEKLDRDAVMKAMLPGQVFHLERIEGKPGTLEYMENQKKYIYSAIQLVVKKMVDVYLEAKETGKLPEFMAHLRTNPGACMEDKGEHLTLFEEENLKEGTEGAGMTKAEIAELQRVADISEGPGAPPPKSEDLIYGTIDALYKTDDAYKTKDEWKDFAGPVKAKILGTTAQIVVPVKDEVRGEYKFVPAVDRNNKPVVRPLTEADIDEIGRACLYNTVG